MLSSTLSKQVVHQALPKWVDRHIRKKESRDIFKRNLPSVTEIQAVRDVLTNCLKHISNLVVNAKLVEDP